MKNISRIIKNSKNSWKYEDLKWSGSGMSFLRSYKPLGVLVVTPPYNSANYAFSKILW